MKQTAQEGGFMYVEVLLGLAILAFGLLAIMPMFILGASQNAASGDLTFAATLAQEKAETLRATRYENLLSGTWEENLTMRSMNYRRQWIIESDSPHSGFKRVTVTVEPIRIAGFGNSQNASITFYHVQ